MPPSPPRQPLSPTPRRLITPSMLDLLSGLEASSAREDYRDRDEEEQGSPAMSLGPEIRTTSPSPQRGEGVMMAEDPDALSPTHTGASMRHFGSPSSRESLITYRAKTDEKHRQPDTMHHPTPLPISSARKRQASRCSRCNLARPSTVHLQTSTTPSTSSHLALHLSTRAKVALNPSALHTAILPRPARIRWHLKIPLQHHLAFLQPAARSRWAFLAAHLSV